MKSQRIRISIYLFTTLLLMACGKAPYAIQVEKNKESLTTPQQQTEKATSPAPAVAPAPTSAPKPTLNLAPPARQTEWVYATPAPIPIPTPAPAIPAISDGSDFIRFPQIGDAVNIDVRVGITAGKCHLTPERHFWIWNVSSNAAGHFGTGNFTEQKDRVSGALTNSACPYSNIFCGTSVTFEGMTDLKKSIGSRLYVTAQATIVIQAAVFAGGQFHHLGQQSNGVVIPISDLIKNGRRIYYLYNGLLSVEVGLGRNTGPYSVCPG